MVNDLKYGVSRILFNYSYIITKHHDPLIENDELSRSVVR
jgi:hypothetical protein